MQVFNFVCLLLSVKLLFLVSIARYIEVQENEKCCPDPTQERVDIGMGNSCCGRIPYLSVNSSQLCCGGRFSYLPLNGSTVQLRSHLQVNSCTVRLCQGKSPVNEQLYCTGQVCYHSVNSFIVQVRSHLSLNSFI